VVKPDALTWKDSPTLPKGAQFTTILGDPTKAERWSSNALSFHPTIKFRHTLIPLSRLPP
jgi:hypothetical protein